MDAVERDVGPGVEQQLADPGVARGRSEVERRELLEWDLTALNARNTQGTAGWAE